MALRRCRRAIAMVDDLLQRRELTRVHVGRALSYVAKRRHLVRAFQYMVVGDQIIEFGATGSLIAPATPAVEFILENGSRTRQATVVNRQFHARWDAGVMKLVVGEQRTVVALRAIRFADEQLEPGDLVVGENPIATLAIRDRIYIPIEPRRPKLDSPLIRGDGFSNVDEYSGDGVTLLLCQCPPRGHFLAVAGRAC